MHDHMELSVHMVHDLPTVHTSSHSNRMVMRPESACLHEQLHLKPAIPNSTASGLWHLAYMLYIELSCRPWLCAHHTKASRTPYYSRVPARTHTTCMQHNNPCEGGAARQPKTPCKPDTYNMVLDALRRAGVQLQESQPQNAQPMHTAHALSSQ